MLIFCCIEVFNISSLDNLYLHSDCPNIERMSVSCSRSTSVLNFFPNLKKLSLELTQPIDLNKTLEGCGQVSVLSLSFHHPTSLEGIYQCIGVSSLSLVLLAQFDAEDLIPLASLTKCTSLTVNCEDCTIPTLRFAKTYHLLERFSSDSTKGIPDLEVICEKPSLKYVTVSGVNKTKARKLLAGTNIRIW